MYRSILGNGIFEYVEAKSATAGEDESAASVKEFFLAWTYSIDIWDVLGRSILRFTCAVNRALSIIYPYGPLFELLHLAAMLIQPSTTKVSFDMSQ